MLIIMDGFGNAPASASNAVSLAKTPNLDKLFTSCPSAALKCSGLAVGLPEGQIGNSEVGHTNIGAGRIIYQSLTRISHEIETGEFFKNEELLAAIKNCRDNNSALHLMGLLSTGGVHSHLTHLYALLRLAKDNGLERVYVHAFLDGRDVPPSSGADFVRECVQNMNEIGIGRIATVSGRYYPMDRDKRWERVEKGYNAMVHGEGEFNENPEEAVRASYEKGITDEFMEPVVCDREGMISNGDSVIFFNFRPDRARQITSALTEKDFDGFDRRDAQFPNVFVCMTQYDDSLKNVLIAFKPQTINNNFGEYISSLGLTQLRIAETEKYAHVTFFFNGGVEEVYPGEDRVLINSPKVATYDLQPEMSAYEVADEVCKRIRSGKYDVIILNFANCDMVGHTGVLPAAIKAVETTDECVGRVIEEIKNAGGQAIITADHGNAEKMVDDDGKPFTAHTSNTVPICIVGADVELKDGSLCDIAPTMLELMGIEKPEEMEGVSLITKSQRD